MNSVPALADRHERALEPQPLPLRASTEALRDTTKWILAVFAGLASVLLAGLRFGDVGGVEPWTGRFYLAAGATAAALAAVGCILWQAALLLSGRYETLRQLVETVERTETENPSVDAMYTNPLIGAIEDEQQYVYQGTAANLRDLFEQLRESNEYLLRARAPGSNTNAAELRAHQERRLVLSDTAARVVDYAEHWVTKRRFQLLMRTMLGGGAVVATGIFLFAMAVSDRQATVPVKTGPVPVRIFFTEAGKGWMDGKAHCRPSVLNGVAVGGTLTKPEVVIPEGAALGTATCSASRFTLSRDLGVAVPMAATTP